MGQGWAARGWRGLHVVASASQFTHVMCLITNSVIAHLPFPQPAQPCLGCLSQDPLLCSEAEVPRFSPVP